MHKIAFLIAGSFMGSLTATQVCHATSSNSQHSEPLNPKIYIQTPKPETESFNLYSPLSEKKTAHYEIMNLAGGYSELMDESHMSAVVEQKIFIESTRHEFSPKKSEKRPSPVASKISESKKAFGNSHTDAALSIIRVHSNYLTTMLPKAKFVEWGGRFMNKINRFEMLYAFEDIPITDEIYAMLLFSFLEDLNLHEERFAPYLATFPVSSEEYELRFMLPGYRTLSTKETPQLVFIFNIGEIVCFCHREKESGFLRVFKKEQFGDIIERVKKKIAEEKEEKTPRN